MPLLVACRWSGYHALLRWFRLCCLNCQVVTPRPSADSSRSLFLMVLGCPQVICNSPAIRAHVIAKKETKHLM